ncbi:hypothetical protein PTKIN_Ptkin01aG0255800 [Pterospermum kingtungense]
MRTDTWLWKSILIGRDVITKFGIMENRRLFLTCSFARAIWFGTDLSIRTNIIALSSAKEWLSKEDLAKKEALWFYDQFICIVLWCIWIHRNDKIFRGKEVTPTTVLFHQKSLLSWIFRAMKSNEEEEDEEEEDKEEEENSNISQQRRKPFH